MKDEQIDGGVGIVESYDGIWLGNFGDRPIGETITAGGEGPSPVIRGNSEREADGSA